MVLVLGTQLGFFGAGRRVLVDDASGRIEYLPEFLDAEIASCWFTELHDRVEWNDQRRRMYDRDVDVPRRTASFRLGPDAPPLLVDAARRVFEETGVTFTSAGLNLYRDGRDSVAPHNDHLDEIAAGFPIALISLGSTRRMTIRSKRLPRRILDTDLEPGSLLVMSYDTQLSYDHSVPKTASTVGPRISIALRVRPIATEQSVCRSQR